MDNIAMPEPDMMEANLDSNMDASLDANLEDLFGEAADGLTANTLNVPLPPAPIPPELELRIASMQTRGCCTKLTWSTTGCVAQIKDNGSKIVFRALIRNMQTGAWSLTEESNYPILASDGTRWEHIQFNNVGTDLAVVDNLGQAFVHTLTGPLGRMPLAPHNVNRNEAAMSDFDAVVGLHWLPVHPAESKFPYITSATKLGEKWSSTIQPRNPSELTVHHAVDSKLALLYVSRDARLTLMFQNESVWQAVDTKLEHMNSSRDVLSHAAMGEDGGTMILVTHDLSRRFRLYRITITWNPSQQPRTQGGQPATIVAPELSIGRLTVLDHVAARHADAATLSQLHIIPAIPSAAADPHVPTYPNVLAIFTRGSSSVDLNQQHQETFSVIARWHVESVIPGIHEAFRKLKPNGTTLIPQSTVTRLRRQEDVITSKLVLSVESQYFNTMLAFVASDGTIEFRERTTMASIEPYPDPTTVTSLPQSGFEHLIDQHFVHVAMSADGSALATVRPDGTLSHKMMTLRYTWHPVLDDGLIEAAVVCLARQYAILCSTSAGNDETLALLPPHLSMGMRSLFVKEVIDALGRSPVIDIATQEVGRQHLTALREPLVPKALSAQFVLGCMPSTAQVNFVGKFAFAFLNMRLAANSIGSSVPKPDNLPKPEYLIALRGLLRWASDLLVFVIAGLAKARRKLDAESRKPDKEFFHQFIMQNDTPVFNLLLCTFSRVSLRFLASCIHKCLAGVYKVAQSAQSVTSRQQLADIFEAGTSLPFQYSEFEVFLGELDSVIRDAYTKGNISPDRRKEIELSLISCDGVVPAELQPVLQSLFDSILPKLLEKTDAMKLYFWDTSWLGIDFSPAAHQLTYDVIRKIPLTKDMKLKKCRRCGAVTEDMAVDKAQDTAVLWANVGRTCICANFWTV